MIVVALDPAKLDAACVKLRRTFDEYNARIARIKPTDPSHWGPNSLSARNIELHMIADDLVDSHFEGRRFRGAALEQRKADLHKAIKNSAAWRELLAYFSRSGGVL